MAAERYTEIYGLLGMTCVYWYVVSEVSGALVTSIFRVLQ